MSHLLALDLSRFRPRAPERCTLRIPAFRRPSSTVAMAKTSKQNPSSGTRVFLGLLFSKLGCLRGLGASFFQSGGVLGHFFDPFGIFYDPWLWQGPWKCQSIGDSKMAVCEWKILSLILLSICWQTIDFYHITAIIIYILYIYIYHYTLMIYFSCSYHFICFFPKKAASQKASSLCSTRRLLVLQTAWSCKTALKMGKDIKDDLSSAVESFQKNTDREVRWTKGLHYKTLCK